MFYLKFEVLHKQPGIDICGAMPVGYCALRCCLRTKEKGAAFIFRERISAQPPLIKPFPNDRIVPNQQPNNSQALYPQYNHCEEFMMLHLALRFPRALRFERKPIRMLNHLSG